MYMYSIQYIAQEMFTRATKVCVSSQIGCKMGCSFCATGASVDPKMLNAMFK